MEELELKFEWIEIIVMMNHRSLNMNFGSDDDAEHLNDHTDILRHRMSVMIAGFAFFNFCVKWCGHVRPLFTPIVQINRYLDWCH